MVSWLLFIYTVPSQPSRKRAAVWRELKRLGAVYLRDGAALLPARDDLAERLQALADRVEEFEGTADLAEIPGFLRPAERDLVERFQHEREEEYRELYRACVRFLRDVLDEVSEDEFGYPDVGNLESELTRLHRWHEQVQERDYFDAGGGERVRAVLSKCDTAFERFAAEASDREGAPTRDNAGRDTLPADDAFQRLAGPPASPDPQRPI